MRIFSASDSIIKYLNEQRDSRKRSGFIPTMGALHEGHFSLIRQAIEENDHVVVSIFVNPLQFNNSEDLKNYPRDIEKDISLLEQLKVDVVFTPDEKTFYEEKPLVAIDFGKMGKVLEGRFRKNHFEGVGIVVSKLLHIIQPNSAYFGLKDLQQFLLIKRMCKDLGFQVNVKGVATVREKSGLAMSSRNQRLSNKGRAVAATIYSGLKQIESSIYAGDQIESIITEAQKFYNNVGGLEVEYLEIINPQNLQPIQSISNQSELAICFAGYVESVRLIDNLYLRLN